jgi:ribonuclease E
MNKTIIKLASVAILALSMNACLGEEEKKEAAPAVEAPAAEAVVADTAAVDTAVVDTAAVDTAAVDTAAKAEEAATEEAATEAAPAAVKKQKADAPSKKDQLKNVTVKEKKGGAQ